MSDSTPAPAPPPAAQPDQPPQTQTVGDTGLLSIVSGGSVFTITIGIIASILFGIGASRLSYVKYGSVGWAFLDFLFPYFYYPFYALVLNEPCAPPMLMGGRRRR